MHEFFEENKKWKIDCAIIFISDETYWKKIFQTINIYDNLKIRPELGMMINNCIEKY